MTKIAKTKKGGQKTKKNPFGSRKPFCKRKKITRKRPSLSLATIGGLALAFVVLMGAGAYWGLLKPKIQPFNYGPLISRIEQGVTEWKNDLETRTISRGEFVHVLASLVPADSENDSTFNCYTDVTNETPYANDICLAKSSKALDSFHSNRFLPSQPITFVEALRMGLASFNLPFSDEDAPWYKGALDQATDLNLIPLSITDSEQTIGNQEAGDLLARLSKSKTQPADETLAPPFFKVTTQTLFEHQNVLERMALGEGQCFYEGLYRDNGSRFTVVRQDNSCEGCFCANGETTCETAPCKPDPVEEIRPEGRYEFPFKPCDPNRFSPATIDPLDQWENLKDLKAKSDAIPQGRMFLKQFLDGYAVCDPTDEKEKKGFDLAESLNLGKDDRDFLMNLGHLLFVFQQDLFDNLDFKSYSAEDVANLGFKPDEDNWSDFPWSSTTSTFDHEFYKLFPLAIQLVEKGNSETEIAQKLSFWLERNLIHYYKESSSGHNLGGTQKYADNLYGADCAFGCKRKGTVTLKDFFSHRVGDCHVSSALLAGLARSMGIPVKVSQRASHGYVHFYRPNLYVHGDMTALPALWPIRDVTPL